MGLCKALNIESSLLNNHINANSALRLVGQYHDDTEWGDAFDWNTRHEDFDSVIPLNKK